MMCLKKKKGYTEKSCLEKTNAPQKRVLFQESDVDCNQAPDLHITHSMGGYYSDCKTQHIDNTTCQK